MHARSLRAALVTGDRIEITEPGESENFGVDQADPCTLDCFGEREPAGPWSWHGPARTVTGRAGGGCVEAIEETFIAGRFPFAPDVLDGGVLLPETPEGLPPARHVGWIVRALGDRVPPRRGAGPAPGRPGPGPVPGPAAGEGRDGPLAAGLPHLDGPP